MAGAVVSTTEIDALQVLDRLPQGTVAVSVAPVNPKPEGHAGDCASVTGSLSASKEPAVIDPLAWQVAPADIVTWRHSAVGEVWQVKDTGAGVADGAGTPLLTPRLIILVSSLLASSQSTRRCFTRLSIAAFAWS